MDYRVRNIINQLVSKEPLFQLFAALKQLIQDGKDGVVRFALWIWNMPPDDFGVLLFVILMFGGALAAALAVYAKKHYPNSEPEVDDQSDTELLQ